jgi:CRP/FNR family cyclic AMP-dependent transcriptional regulator
LRFHRRHVVLPAQPLSLSVLRAIVPMDISEPQIFQRFSSDRGEALIIEALKDQKIILGNEAAAEELCARGKLTFFREGDFLATEDSWENSIVFILAGSAQITITGFKVAERRAGQHIGEMALIDPSQPRSASVKALEPTVGLIISEEDFSAVAAHHPDIWRQIAKEVAQRLRQRKKFIRPSNPVPFIFIACASESLSVAEAIRDYFEGKGEVVAEVWTDDVFKPSKGTMESLEEKLETSDFAVAIFSADDKVESRGEEKVAPRDNTVFELGLFGGAIGRERSFFALERDVDMKIPSDLAGITSLRFSRPVEAGGGPAVEEACLQIEARIRALGPR